jgi:hypothetical protein
VVEIVEDKTLVAEVTEAVIGGDETVHVLAEGGGRSTSVLKACTF